MTKNTGGRLTAQRGDTGGPVQDVYAFLVNRSRNRPSSEGAAERFDRARTLCREAGFQGILFRGDTDVSLTHLTAVRESS